MDNQPVVDIKLVMHRLTKLPDLKQISCKHSGGSEIKIALFGVLAQCGENDQEYVIYKVNKHIVRSQRRFNIKRYKEGSRVLDLDSELMHMKDVGISQINLKFLEMIFVLFVVISFIAFMTALSAEQLKNTIENSWLFILTLILICTFLGIVFNMAFVIIYKYLVLMEIKQRAQMSARNEKVFLVLVRIFYVVSIVVALGLVIGSYTVTHDNHIIPVLKWFSATFCSSSLTAFLWCYISHSSFSSPKEEVYTSEQTINSLSVTSQMA